MKYNKPSDPIHIAARYANVDIYIIQLKTEDLFSLWKEAYDVSPAFNEDDMFLTRPAHGKNFDSTGYFMQKVRDNEPIDRPTVRMKHDVFGIEDGRHRLIAIRNNGVNDLEVFGCERTIAFLNEKSIKFKAMKYFDAKSQ